MENHDLAHKAAAVRRFNRFYTRQIGLLQDGLLDSPYTLTEARVVYELAQHEKTTATELAGELGLDPGYLSRILTRLQNQGLIAKKTSHTDGRQRYLSLTPAGQEAFTTLNTRSQGEFEAMLTHLSPEKQNTLVESMTTIESLLGESPGRKAAILLRPPQPGDMGWVVHRHGVLYAMEYQWDETFEALVAEIVARYIQQFDPKKERCWIAEKDGENVGSVFLVKQDDTTAKLRLLLVEPKARGFGIGSRLVQECVRYARQVGYRKMTLWTNDVLTSARAIYEELGFRLVHEEPHHSFGQDLVGQTWDLDL